jgi:glycosyltransferase involved in cell wall biosynthesis
MQPLTRPTLVSIIIPSFNQGRFIKETIDSVLGQDYRPIEVLVLDGGSTDQTVEVLKSYTGVPELNWVSEPDKGVVDAVNKGLKRVRGEIVGIQSSDDLYLPGAIAAAVEYFNSHPDISLVYGDAELIDENSQSTGKDILAPFDLRHYLGRFTYIPQPSAFFRATVLDAVAGWRQEVSYAADADFWLRIAVRHKVAKIDRMIGRYRYHSEQRDTQKAKISRDWEASITDLMANSDMDRRSRRFARMGIHLARYRYTSESNWRLRTLELYRAAFANPAAVFHPSFPNRELMVGRQPIWKFLSRVKRLLGFKPRGSANKWGTL